MALDMTTERAGLKTLPHFCEATIAVPPFDLSLIGMPTQMSPVMERENGLLNLVLGSPVKNMALPWIGQSARG